MIDKQLVKERFRKNLKTYNNNCFVQDKMAEKLVEMIRHNPCDILELGCGTGILTKKLLEQYSFKTYTAIDMVKECEEYIRKISPEIKFYQADIESCDFKGKYDLIISNAVFQWIENPKDFMTKLKGILKPNGTIIFSTFGQENLKEIKQLTGMGLKYYSYIQLREILSPSTIKEDIFTLEFDTPKEILKHLKCTGVNSLSKTSWTKSNLKKFETDYNKLCPDKIILTYNPVYLIIQN